MSLSQEQRNEISAVASTIEEQKGSSPTAVLVSIGGFALVAKLQGVADKESAAEAFYVIGMPLLKEAESSNIAKMHGGNLGMMALYAASLLLK